MRRALKYLFRIAILAALGLVAYAMLTDLPPPQREVEVDLRSETLLAAADVPRPETTPLVHFADGVDVRILRATSGRVARGTV